jgi:uncharacterized protein YcaQ
LGGRRRSSISSVGRCCAGAWTARGQETVRGVTSRASAAKSTLVKAVRERIVKEGALAASDFKGARSQGSWWGRRDTKCALEGWRAAAYAVPPLKIPRKGVVRALLSPVDNLIWNRKTCGPR